jgi:hypothetical protein
VDAALRKRSLAHSLNERGSVSKVIGKNLSRKLTETDRLGIYSDRPAGTKCCGIARGMLVVSCVSGRRVWLPMYRQRGWHGVHGIARDRQESVGALPDAHGPGGKRTAQAGSQSQRNSILGTPRGRRRTRG